MPRPDTEYRRVAIGRRSERTQWLWAEDGLLEHCFGHEVETWGRRWHHVLGPDVFVAQRRFFRRCSSADAEDPASLEADGIDLLRRIAADVLPSMTKSYEGSRKSEARAHDAIAFLCANLGEPLELGPLAQAVGVTPAHLCSLFKSATGRTLSRYVRTLRLCVGVDRLRERRADLAALAFELGFSSHSHFSARFRAEFGMTPRAARELLQGPAQAGP